MAVLQLVVILLVLSTMSTGSTGKSPVGFKIIYLRVKVRLSLRSFIFVILPPVQAEKKSESESE